MLVLSRKENQSIMIGDNIEIIVVDIKPDQVKIGIIAPEDIKIYRKEIYLEIQLANKEALEKKFNANQIRNLLKKNKKGDSN
ncbi:MAG: carbon storage regulator CsrA [Spirochaetes bacterium]|nr:carbon storage regulator CsrA [Spirochaetota bacterium]